MEIYLPSKITINTIVAAKSLVLSSSASGNRYVANLVNRSSSGNNSSCWAIFARDFPFGRKALFESASELNSSRSSEEIFRPAGQWRLCRAWCKPVGQDRPASRG